MSLRIIVAALATIASAATAATAQDPLLPIPNSTTPVVGVTSPATTHDSPTPPEASMVRLRNVAAADAAKAMNAFAASKKIPVTVVCEPVSNTICVAGDKASVKQLLEIAVQLDKTPQVVIMQIVYWEAPTGAAEKIGLADPTKKDELMWSISGRELRMLQHILALSENCNVISRPQVIVADNQTGHVQVCGVPFGLSTRITPRILPDGMLLNMTTDVRRGQNGERSMSEARMTAKLPEGMTLVRREWKGDEKEILSFTTCYIVENKK